MNLFGLTANIIDACFLIFGKTGKILNARGNRICFLFDIICLTYWCYMDIQRGLISQGISCLVSISICIYGFYRWGKKNPLLIQRNLPDFPTSLKSTQFPDG